MKRHVEYKENVTIGEYACYGEYYGIPYTFYLTGPSGARFILFIRTNSDTDKKMLKQAKTAIREDHDVEKTYTVSIKWTQKISLREGFSNGNENKEG